MNGDFVWSYMVECLKGEMQMDNISCMIIAETIAGAAGKVTRRKAK